LYRFDLSEDRQLWKIYILLIYLFFSSFLVFEMKDTHTHAKRKLGERVGLGKDIGFLDVLIDYFGNINGCIQRKTLTKKELILLYLQVYSRRV